MGVDFGPYLQRVLHDVKQNWYAIIPESAMPPLLKKGKLSIEFAITKNGEIAGLRYDTSSGDVALDRAAYGGITASNPFPPLPAEFVQAAKRENRDAALGLKFTFLYNPDPNEADLH
jgi:TonB family protein